MADELAAAVCDVLVANGKLKATPAFIRKDREAKIVKVFEQAKLDKAALEAMNGRSVEVAVRNATQGEAWVDDVQTVLKGMLSEEAAKDTAAPPESEEMKALRQKMVDNAKLEFANGDPPPNPAGPGGGRGGGGGGGRGGDDEAYGHFGGRGGDGGRACYNCGQEGHLSRDCPEARKDGGGSFGGGDFGGGGGRECYNCGQSGHMSRDCPEPRKDGGGGRGRACYNCGQEGHQARDCPEPRRSQ